MQDSTNEIPKWACASNNGVFRLHMGHIGQNGADDHPIYVRIDTKESREFGDYMSSGQGGPLD